MAKRTRDEVLETANKFGVNLVRFLYTDLAGLTRGKSTAMPHFKDRIDTGIGLVKGMMAMNCLDKMQTDTGFGATGEVRMVPDLNTFVVLPYVGSAASVLCDLVELDKTPWEMCPRSLLKRLLKEVQSMGISVQAAFETEFMLGTSDFEHKFQPIDHAVCFGTDGMNRVSKFSSRLVDYLHRQKLSVEQVYPELGHGQHEVSISHGPALEACDNYLVLRETLRGLALEQDLMVTTAPKPWEDQPGNGCHIHLSVWDKFGERNMMWSDDGLSELGLQFVAGIVEHLPSLVAITCPSVNSYRRLRPRSWSSAYKCWGYENREAAVRVPSLYWGHEMASTNIELKCVDNTVNPYLALACIIACGLEGIKKKMTPPPPLVGDPADLSDHEREKLGIEPLPSSLHKALVELETDVFLMKFMGEKLANTFVQVKQSEVAAFALDVDFELSQHRLRY